MRKTILTILCIFGLLAAVSCKKNNPYTTYTLRIEESFASEHPKAVIYLNEYNGTREYIGTSAHVNVKAGLERKCIAHEDSKYVKVKFNDGMAEAKWIRVVYVLEKGRNIKITLNSLSEYSSEQPSIP